jgi:hypothetical protein
MYVIRRLKPDRNFIAILLPFGILVVGAFLGAIFGLKAAFSFIAVFFWIYASYSALTYIRTGNTGFVVVALFQLSAGLVAFATPGGGFQRISPGMVLFLVALEIFFVAWLVILTVNKQIKWRGREIMELAATPIEDIGHGYTSRPLPAGKTEFSRNQILEFAEFARRNLLAVTYRGKEKVVLVPVMVGREFGFILGLKGDYTDETWVAFDNDGKVTVNIAHRDYLEYKESLAFDQLCESLGNLFVEFVETYHRGEGVRIIDRLNDLMIPFYS